MIDIKLSDLFEACPRCKGTGQIDERDGNRRLQGGCPDCNGLRGKLTPSGRELAKFVELINQRGSW